MKIAHLLANLARAWKTFARTTSIPWRLLSGLLLLDLFYAGIAIFRPFRSEMFVYGYGVGAILYPLLLAMVCFKGTVGLIDRLNHSNGLERSGRRFSPLLLGIALLIYAYSQLLLFLTYIITGQEALFPSAPYFLVALAYPFLICAVLLLPSRGVSLLARLRIFLDSLIIIVVIGTICYYFVLAPMLIQGDGTQIEITTGLLYPTADLALMFCLLLVALRSGEVALRPALVMISLAFLVILVMNMVHFNEILQDTFHWISPWNVGWAFALTLLTGAAQTVKNILQKTEVSGSNEPALPSQGASTSFPTSRLKALFSPMSVLVVSLLVFILWLSGIKKIFLGDSSIIYVGGFVVLMLIVLRQLLAIYEVGLLQTRLQKRNRALSLLNDLLEKRVTTDSLTGLPNHRELMAKLDEALARARQTGSSCAVIFMDLDYFKGINDYFGHIVGDAVLCEFSELVLAEMRACDYVGRWGGEEFVAVLPGMDSGEAFRVAEHIRQLVEGRTFADEQEVCLNCSLGVAAYPSDATRCEDLLTNADQAMYTAKRLGRNQTRIASEPLVLAMGMLGEAPETAEEAEMLAVVEALIAALEARDSQTGQHSRRVAALALKLALALGQSWSDACIIGMGGLLHDLGKVAMPDTILFKHGKLSAAEIEYIARHPLIGEEILAPLPSLRKVAAIVRSHHEWMDGSGYPDGLKGEEIPLGARIVAVADAYDAIISHRIYREGRASSEATRELRKGAGRQFDARVVAELDHLLASAPRLSAIGAA